MPGPYLLAITALAIGLLLLLILRWKLHAFLALLASALALGIMARMPPKALLASFQNGMADLLGSVAIIVGAGAVLGRIIEVSGGGEVMARTLIAAFGKEHVPWALLLASYIVGIPVFFDAGFFALAPLVWSISKETGKSLLLYAMPVLSALTATHGLIPTHPGAAAAAQLFSADLVKTILYGLALAVPMSVAGGIVFGKWISRRIHVPPPEHLVLQSERPKPGRQPGFLVVLSVILLPVILISLKASMPHAAWLQFFGSTPIALLIGAVAALIVLGFGSGFNGSDLLRHTAESLNSVGALILVIGASGALKQVIVDSGAGLYFAELLLRSHISPLFMAFLVGAAFRITIGSATASIVTAAGIVAPLAASFRDIDPALMVMAVALGGSILSHVNDAGFWMVKEYCGMTVSQALRSYSVMKAVTSLVGLLSLWLLSLFL